MTSLTRRALVGAAVTTATAAAQSSPDHKDLLRFWRLHMDSGKGDWHLLNEEDRRFLRQVREKITSGEYRNTRLEYAEIEGRLPE